MDTDKILLLKTVILEGGEVAGETQQAFTVEEVERLILELKYIIYHKATP